MRVYYTHAEKNNASWLFNTVIVTVALLPLLLLLGNSGGQGGGQGYEAALMAVNDDMMLSTVVDYNGLDNCTGGVTTFRCCEDRLHLTSASNCSDALERNLGQPVSRDALRMLNVTCPVCGAHAQARFCLDRSDWQGYMVCLYVRALTN